MTGHSLGYSPVTFLNVGKVALTSGVLTVVVFAGMSAYEKKPPS